jgi:hypothetical protein
MKKRAYQFAIVFAVAFTFAHLISLPIGITYDGYQYLDGADILGSSRFPADWYRNRTPLYSLTLKTSFLLFGHQPIAAILVSTAMGLGTVLLLGRAARLLAGEWCGAVVVVLVSVFPTSVAYQHLILTETGTSFFIALLISIALQQPKTQRAAWLQAAFFCVVLAAGYYWRQLLLDLAPLAALTWLVRNWAFVRQHSTVAYLYLGRIALAIVIIVAAPLALSHFWDRYSDRAGLAEVSLRQGIIRQALIAPSDPVIGQNKALYIDAIRQSSSQGNFFSGIRNDFFDSLLEVIFGPRPMGVGDTKRIFVSSILHYPARYLAGVTRTAVLFLGAKATVNENRIFRDQILSPDWQGAKIGQGPPAVEMRIKQQFQQVTTSSAVLQILSRLCPIYDVLLILGNVVAAAAIPYALFARNYKAFVLAAFPIAYLALYTIILASIDRFAMPAYPFTLTILIVLPVLVVQHFHRVRNAAAPPASSSAITDLP